MKSWLKKYWKYLLIIPAVLVALAWAGRWIYLLLSSPEIDTSEIDREHSDNMSKLQEDELDVVKKSAKEREDIWRRIDKGNPSPSEIFDVEINR